jgi:zinc transporter ZupT
MIIKVVFIFVIFAIALVAGVLPAKIKGCGQNKTFMGLANAFSGGLFLAIALVHVLPEVTEEYNHIMEEKNKPANIGLESSLGGMIVQHINHLHLLVNGVMQDSEMHPFSSHPQLTHGEGSAPFPLPFVLVFAGYSFILIIDRVMFDSHALFEHGNDEEKGGHGHKDEHHSENIKSVPSINNRA